MPLTKDDVDWVAHLARLALTADERVAMAAQLGAIVDYVHALQQVNTEGVEPMAHALEFSNVFREDVPVASLPVDAVLGNAPDRRGAFYGVPAVFES